MCIRDRAAGVRSGAGACAFGSGDLYEGTWKEDRMHGTGALMQSTGQLFVGSFAAGAPPVRRLSSGCSAFGASATFTVPSTSGVTRASTEPPAPIQPDLWTSSRSGARGDGQPAGPEP